MDAVAFELRLGEDVIQDLGNKRRPSRTSDFPVLLAGSIADQPWLDADEHDHRPALLDPLNEDIQIGDHEHTAVRRGPNVVQPADDRRAAERETGEDWVR